MRNVSGKSCIGNRNTHFVFSNIFFENRAVYDIILKNVLEWGMPQMRICGMRIACCIPTATNTHSDCIIPVAIVVARTLLSVKFISTLPVLSNIHLNFVSFLHVFHMRLSFQIFQPKSCMNFSSSTYSGLIYIPT